jgi:hypothetical protein
VTVLSVPVRVEAAAELGLDVGREGAEILFGQEAEQLDGQRERLVMAVEAGEALLARTASLRARCSHHPRLTAYR